MKALLRKLKKLLKAVNFKNMKSILRYIKKNGFKGLYTTCVNHLRFGKTVVDEYATWIANNEPNQEGLDKQREYISCQDLKFSLILPKNSKEELIKSIEEQTYNKFEIIRIGA